MFAQAYLCTQNNQLSEIRDSVEISWITKFIGRKIIPEKYHELFDHNGYYYENEQYYMNDIVANINPTVDENGFITDISSYKVKDKSCGHGRPQTDDRDLSKRDISHFSKVLDSVTVDHVAAQYTKLKASFQKDELLPGDYRFVSATATGITLLSSNGEKRCLSKAKLLQGLVISHNFIDVLFCVETLESAPEYFAKEEIPLYLAVFSKVEHSDYMDYDRLVREAESRVLLRQAEAGYLALIEAVKAENLTMVREYIKFAPLVIVDKSIASEPPVIIAARKNNIPIMRLLLEGGAFSKEAYLDEQKISVSPLHIAVQNQNYEMIQLICQYRGAEIDNYSAMRYNFWIHTPQTKFKLDHIFSTIGGLQDFEALKIILPYAAKSLFKPAFDPNVFAEITAADMDFMIAIDGAAITWPLALVKSVYPVNREKSVMMMRQGCDIEVVDYFIEVNDYPMFEMAVQHHNCIRPRESFASVYERGGQWYQTLIKASSPDFNYMVLRQDRDKYLGKLIKAEMFVEFKSAVRAMGIDFPVEALDAFINYPKGIVVSDEMQHFFEYVLDHCGYTERIENGSSTTDVAFHFYTDALLYNASYTTAQKFLEKYPLRITRDDKVFDSKFEGVVEYRGDDLYRTIILMKLNYESTREVDEKWLRYANFGSYRQKFVYETFYKIIFRYSRKEDDLTHDYSWVNKEKSALLAERWLEVLKSFLQLISLAEVNESLQGCKYKRHENANTAYEFALAEGVKNEEVLTLLK